MYGLLLITPFAFSQELPKDCLGKYAGEMQAYSVTVNDVELNIEKHDVHVEIFPQTISYTSGTISLKGSYTFLKQSGAEYLIKAKLSNGRTVAYDIDLLWNKKTKTLLLAGKNGEPDLVLVKLEK